MVVCITCLNFSGQWTLIIDPPETLPLAALNLTWHFLANALVTVRTRRPAKERRKRVDLALLPLTHRLQWHRHVGRLSLVLTMTRAKQLHLGLTSS